MKIFIGVGIALITIGCSTSIKTSKLESPIHLQAIKNFQPPGVMGRSEYTIYEDSKWDCKYKTENNDYVCCTRESFSSMSPWKYCLIADNSYKAFGFFELGSSVYAPWSSGKEELFKVISE